MPSYYTHHRPVAGLLLACQVTATAGCTSWQTQAGDAATVLAASPQLQPDSIVPAGGSGQGSTTATASSIRVITATGRSEFHSPRIANDSLLGRVNNNSADTGIPLSAITGVQVRETSPGKTVGLVVGLSVAAFLLVGSIYYASCGPFGC